MDSVTKSFRKDESLTSWILLQHICPHFWAWLLNTIAITPKSEDKYVVKVFNSSEFHLSEMTLLQNPYFSYFLGEILTHFSFLMPLQHMTCQFLGFFRSFQQYFCPFGKVLCQAFRTGIISNLLFLKFPTNKCSLLSWKIPRNKNKNWYFDNFDKSKSRNTASGSWFGQKYVN